VGASLPDGEPSDNFLFSVAAKEGHVEACQLYLSKNKSLAVSTTHGGW
jgi:hypothetical protein